MQYYTATTALRISYDIIIPIKNTGINTRNKIFSPAFPSRNPVDSRPVHQFEFIFKNNKIYRLRIYYICLKS